jgi:hypothetical protein
MEKDFLKGGFFYNPTAPVFLTLTGFPRVGRLYLSGDKNKRKIPRNLRISMIF